MKRNGVVLFGILLAGIILPYSQATTGFGRLLGKLFEVPSQEDFDKRQRDAEKAWDELRQQLENFTQRKDTMPAEESAAQWLAFFDRVYGAQVDPMEYGFRPNAFETLIKAIPGPAAWPELSRLVAERPAQSGALALREDLLGMLICRLTGDYSGLRGRLHKVMSEWGGAPKQGGSYIQQAANEAYMEIQPRVSRFLGKDVEGFEEQVNMLADPKIKLERWNNDLIIPDLVGLAGEAKARELILKALSLAGVSLDVPCGGPTLALVKKLAVEQIDLLGAPQWELVTSPADTVLFEKMSLRFPLAKAARSSFFSAREDLPVSLDYGRERAMRLYVAGMVLRKQLDQAVDYVVGLDTRILEQFEDLNDLVDDVPANSYPDLISFYDAVLEQHPTAPVREGLAACVLWVGDTERAIKALTDQLAANKLKPEERVGIQLELAKIYFALDQIDSGLAIYNELLAIDPSGKPSKLLQKLIDVGKKTIQLGALLENEDLVAKGIRCMTGAGREKDRIENKEWVSDYGWQRNLIQQLVEMKRYPEAEILCDEAIASALKKNQAKSDSGRMRMHYSLGYQNGAPAQLLTIYNETGRFGKSIELLETYPLWGQKDLVGFVHDSADLLYHSARALHETGRDGEAMAALKTYLFRNPDYDPGYRLLLDIQGEAALPMLDEIYSRDRFEERPLIWKAQLLHDLGRLQEAEDTIRLALKVDPTDGEQRDGDRVRAYSVLSDILTARGQAEDAAFFADVVKSVRVAEIGDACYGAGLILRGLRQYEKAETLFADAYCIQWRLAERLYSLGRTEEAKAHYEIAFKRLPEQFGRVASFCFGCEGVFSTEHTRSIAEGILAELKKTSPDRPQLYYLMGTLRQNQERHADAYAEFRHAVELDPDYLDAWEMLNDLSELVSIPQSERDAIQLRIHELDPLQRHVSLDESNFADLAIMWQVLKDSEKYVVQQPDSLLPLPASAAYIERLAEEMAEEMDMLYPDAYFEAANTPENAMANDGIIRSIGELLEALAGY